MTYQVDYSARRKKVRDDAYTSFELNYDKTNIIGTNRYDTVFKLELVNAVNNANNTHFLIYANRFRNAKRFADVLINSHKEHKMIHARLYKMEKDYDYSKNWFEPSIAKFSKGARCERAINMFSDDSKWV